MKSKIIIVEGPQGSGKTTITDYIRYILPYTNLYRLSGTSDSSEFGREKSKNIYINLIKYIKAMQNMDINLLFDRTFFTEEIYCRLGFKKYSFTDIYKTLLAELSEMNYEIYYITLYLSNLNDYEKRLQRDNKANIKYASFSINSSIRQQEEYLKLSDEIRDSYPSINVINIDNSMSEEKVKEEIKKIFE
jgi:thymidylate kinase